MKNIQINKAYKPLFDTKYRFNLLTGGASSGKSHALTQILTAKLAEKEHKLLIIRKVHATHRESTFEEFYKRIFDFGFEKYCKTDLSNIQHTKTLTFDFGTHRSSIIFRGMDAPEKIKGVSGITLVWLEEISEFTAQDFDMIDRSIREKGARIFMSTNPVNKNIWFKSYFNLPNILSERKYFEDKKINLLHIHTTCLDNEFLAPETIEALNNQKHRNLDSWKINFLGEWGNFSTEGQIYKNFKSCTDDEFDNLKGDYVEYFGLDYGFNHYSALVHVKQLQDKYFIKLALYENKLTPSKLCKKVFDYLVSVKNTVSKIYVDSARPDLIDELAEAYNLNANLSNKKVIEGINFVQSLDIKYVENDDFKNEIDKYSWKFDKISSVYIDEVIKSSDDILDSCRYCLYTHYLENQDFAGGYPVRIDYNRTPKSKNNMYAFM